MKKYQKRGYYLEKIVQIIMRNSGYIDVKSAKIPGRGADHQIDSYGHLQYPPAFTYPLRLLAEVKWLGDNDKIVLPFIRNFVGVVKDISENYFVPGSLRNYYSKNTFLGDRYNDCGAFFAANPFSYNAQQYAWAQNIFLIPLGTNILFKPIIKRAKELIEQIEPQIEKKNEIFDRAQEDSLNDNELRQALRISSYLGIIDGIYPTIFLTKNPLRFSAQDPDEVYAEKGSRMEVDNNVDINLNFRDENFSFSLPKSIAGRLINAIENTYKGTPFGYIDTFVKIESNGHFIRRIFRINMYVRIEELRDKYEIKEKRSRGLL